MDKIKVFILNNKAILLAISLLIILTFSTNYYGSTDLGDYTDSAKYFAGHYQAKLRNSHSYLFGFIHYPFVNLTKDFISFKISSLIFLFSIVYSVYYISGKNKKSLLLILFSPIIWYMAPWANPVQLASLLLLWAYYFMVKYDEKNNPKYLFLSGVFMGLSGSVWHASLYFSLALIISFLYNKKVYHLLLLFLAILIGLIPILIMDALIFNFPFYTILRTTISQSLFIFFGGGIYDAAASSNKIFDIIFIFLFLPVYFWLLYRYANFKENKKSIIFISLSILIILSNPQIRYALAIIPIIILLISKEINETRLKRYLIASIILISILLIPYVIQINHSINNKLEVVEINSFIRDLGSIKISKGLNSDILLEDIENIANDYPDQIFIVGNKPDDYQVLADLYWGNKVKEFVSIQDYNLYLKNSSILFEKRFMPVPNIKDRRQIWIIGGISKNENDDTDYRDIALGISINESLNLDNFKLIKKYNLLYLYKKI